MKPKAIVTVLLLAFVAASVIYLVAKETSGTSTQPSHSQPAVTSGVKLIAHYFHGNMRCATCRTIEAYAKEAIESGFPDALKDGCLTWSVVNMDTPSNRHFIEDFQLVASSVVIEMVVNGKRRRWKNLDRVWEMVRDKSAFLKYIQDETRTYLVTKN